LSLYSEWISRRHVLMILFTRVGILFVKSSVVAVYSLSGGQILVADMASEDQLTTAAGEDLRFFEVFIFLLMNRTEHTPRFSLTISFFVSRV